MASHCLGPRRRHCVCFSELAGSRGPCWPERPLQLLCLPLASPCHRVSLCLCRVGAQNCPRPDPGSGRHGLGVATRRSVLSNICGRSDFQPQDPGSSLHSPERSLLSQARGRALSSSVADMGISEGIVCIVSLVFTERKGAVCVFWPCFLHLISLRPDSPALCLHVVGFPPSDGHLGLLL